MALSNDLISEFVKATRDKQKVTKESTAYGKIVKQGDNVYVQLDGSDLLTPVSSTTVVKDEDRVMVTIKNHSAVVTGDLTNPSANDKDVKEIGNNITEFEIIMADKVTTQDLEAINAYFENIKAVSGKYTELSAITAEIETLQAKYANMDHISAKDVQIINAEIETLKGKFGEFTQMSVEDLEAINAEFSNIVAYNAEFTYVSAEVLDVIKGNINELNTKKLDAESAKIIYANIDFSNIGEAAIEKLFSDSGIIQDLIMSDGKVTGQLVGVTITGDLIEGNTVKADKLVILGEDGLYYKLNVNALGETTAKSDPKYQNGLDGSIIVAESITAEKIAVDDLVAFGATIGGFHIDDHSLYSGVKNSVSNTTQGIYLGDDGQIAIGDSNNYMKFFVDENGMYKLEISASSIKFGTSGKTVEETINEVKDEIDNISIGGTNLLRGTQTQDTTVGNIIENAQKTSIVYKTCTVFITSSAWADIGFDFKTQIIDRNLVKVGDKVTYSIYAKTDDTNIIPILFFASKTDATHYIKSDRIILTNEWNRYSFTFEITSEMLNTSSTYLKRIRFEANINCSSGKYVYWAAPKLELGTVSTDWNPAPEDIENNYYSKTETDAKFQIQSDKITSTVSRVETVENVANNAKYYIDNLEVGGRNLALRTKTLEEFEDTNSYRHFFRFKNTNAIVERDDDFSEIRATGAWQGVGTNAAPYNFKPGDKITLSINVDAVNASGEVGLYMMEYDSEGTRIYIPLEINGLYYTNSTSATIARIESNVSQRISCEFTWNEQIVDIITNNGMVNITIQCSTFSTEVDDGYISFYAPKIEIGTIATDWTPAPEDMATGEEVENAQTTADNAYGIADQTESRVTVNESLIQQLSNSISSLVRDSNGSSLMTQTSDGWVFSTESIEKSIEDTLNGLSNLAAEVGSTNNTVSILQQTVDDLGVLSEYVKITTYEDEPCIELGEDDTDFKLLITNTRIMFMEGSSVPVYINNQSLYTKKVIIEDELQQGGFSWVLHGEGNLGLSWKGADV